LSCLSICLRNTIKLVGDWSISWREDPSHSST
jgi:hypothetical protein